MRIVAVVVEVVVVAGWMGGLSGSREGTLK